MPTAFAIPRSVLRSKLPKCVSVEAELETMRSQQYALQDKVSEAQGESDLERTLM
jgi:hypothetical protein